MRISDWSSDVCSSDLLLAGLRFLALFGAAVASLGLVFDPRYRMFPIAGFAIPAAGFALHFLLTRARTGEEAVEEIWLAVLLAVAGIVVAINEGRSEEHTSELQSLMRISYAVFCLKKKQQ